MAGTPTEAQIVAQWKAGVDCLETLRNFADGTMAAAAGKFNALETILNGDFLPVIGSGFTADMRAALSGSLTPGTASGFLQGVVYEYMRILAADATSGFSTGSGYRSITDAMRALFEYYVQKGFTIKSRTITYDTTGTFGNANTAGGAGSIVGNGSMSRLTVDALGFNLEACNVEKKTFRCRADQNTGADKEAEIFEFVGAQASFDSLLRTTNAHGSGEAARTSIYGKNAGGGNGGSLLNNSSFSDYNASNTPKFTNWTETNNGAQVTQDTTNFYRDFPGSTVSAAMKFTASGSVTITVTQALAAMKARRFDPNTPMFLRVMVNKTIGSATGGTINVRFGSQTITISVASLGANWQELILPIGTACWPKNFDTNALSLQIEWVCSASTGFLLFDDAILCPWDLIDGTYWLIRQKAATSPVAWKLDDTMVFTDTGGAPATGKLQYWLFVAGLGYLPSSGTPTYADP